MDRQRIGAFLDRFVGVAAGATTIALFAVADRSGLLAWLHEHGSGKVEDIAEKGGFDPRYAREILSGLTAAGAVDYDPESEVFTLPPEHALFLADESSPYFMGGWFDMIPAAMSQIDGVARATVEGGGVAFEDFGIDMIRGIARGNTPSQKVFLVDRWLSAVPGLLARLESGIRVADVGCGLGTAAILMAQNFPRSSVFGFDVSETTVQEARSRADGISNLQFEESAVDAMPVDPPFDLVTAFDVIHDLARPLDGLTRIREALAPDGRFLMMEPNASTDLKNNRHDHGALLYGISVMHCMTQSLAAGGEGVGAAWGREMAEDYARVAGFSSFEPLEAIENRFSSFYLLKP